MEGPDRMPPLVVSSIAIVGIIWVLMVLGIRLYLRCKLNGPMGNDDYAAILATSLGIAHSALVLATVDSGLGRQQSRIQNELINDERIVEASPPFSCLLSANQPDWTTRACIDKTDLPLMMNSSVMQRPFCILRQPTSPELRAACYISA